MCSSRVVGILLNQDGKTTEKNLVWNYVSCGEQKFKKFFVIIWWKWLPKEPKFLIILPEANIKYGILSLKWILLSWMHTTLIKVLEIMHDRKRGKRISGCIWIRILWGIEPISYLWIHILVLNCPKISFCYFTFYLGSTLNWLTSFHLKRGCSFSAS